MSDIDTLREHLFDTLKALKDPDKPMEIERAKAITDTAQVIINCAKVEVDFLKANGSIETKFFSKPALPSPTSGSSLPNNANPDDHQDEGVVKGEGDRTIETGKVTVDHRNGQRIVTHKMI